MCQYIYCRLSRTSQFSIGQKLNKKSKSSKSSNSPLIIEQGTLFIFFVTRDLLSVQRVLENQLIPTVNIRYCTRNMVNSTRNLPCILKGSLLDLIAQDAKGNGHGSYSNSSLLLEQEPKWGPGKRLPLDQLSQCKQPIAGQAIPYVAKNTLLPPKKK